jgi:sec-independent protein translocase protein TatB
MFEVGFTEIILIFGIALLVLGPARLPKLAADLGRWAGRARAMARQLRSQLEQEVQFDPLATNSTMSNRPAPGHGTIHAPPPPTPALTETAPVSPAAEDASATPTAQTVPDERKPG